MPSILSRLRHRGNVIRIANIEFVDLGLGHELLDLDGAFAFNGDRLELLHVDIFAFESYPRVLRQSGNGFRRVNSGPRVTFLPPC
jgi:hypothetical protein